MSNVTMVFSEDLMLPTDDSGVLIVDNNGNTLNVVSVTQPGALNELLYSGAWTPSDPVPGLNPVTVHYSASVGDIMSLDTYSVPSFSSLVPACGRATNLNALVYNYERIDISWDESADDPSVTYELFRNGESIQTFVHGENSYTIDLSSRKNRRWNKPDQENWIERTEQINENWRGANPVQNGR